MILGVTSAPDVREVDEFQEELSAAEKQKRRIQDKLVNGKTVPKDKLNLSVRKNEQVMFKYSERATKFRSNLPIVLTLLSNVKMGDIFNILWPSQKI
jgi:predicted  nucleic acid-binding Zn-ribbon protein